jgi:RES domain-containing protein
VRLWRLVKEKHSATAFTGEGAALAGGRFNPKGMRVAYTASSLSLAAMETLVHATVQQLRMRLAAIAVTLPVDLAVRRVTEAELPQNWRDSPAPAALAEIGRAWLAAGVTAAMEVPSSVVPGESNVLLNPLHPDFTRIQLGSPELFMFDPRLVKQSPPEQRPRRGGKKR